MPDRDTTLTPTTSSLQQAEQNASKLQLNEEARQRMHEVIKHIRDNYTHYSTWDLLNDDTRNLLAGELAKLCKVDGEKMTGFVFLSSDGLDITLHNGQHGDALLRREGSGPTKVFVELSYVHADTALRGRLRNFTTVNGKEKPREPFKEKFQAGVWSRWGVVQNRQQAEMAGIDARPYNTIRDLTVDPFARQHLLQIIQERPPSHISDEQRTTRDGEPAVAPRNYAKVMELIQALRKTESESNPADRRQRQLELLRDICREVLPEGEKDDLQKVLIAAARTALEHKQQGTTAELGNDPIKRHALNAGNYDVDISWAVPSDILLCLTPQNEKDRPSYQQAWSALMGSDLSPPTIQTQHLAELKFYILDAFTRLLSASPEDREKELTDLFPPK